MCSVWLLNSIHLELVDVSVCLSRGSHTLACVNFVKSHLNVDSFSDCTQDVDLVSQEILITDTRFLGMFTPIHYESNLKYERRDWRLKLFNEYSVEPQ